MNELFNLCQFRVEQKTTLEAQVDAQMQQYPLFKGNTVAASLAKDSIMNLMAADSKADPEQVVRSAAGRLQELLTQRQQDVVEELGGSRMMVQEADRKHLNADGLRSGATRQLAQRLVAGLKPQS